MRLPATGSSHICRYPFGQIVLHRTSRTCPHRSAPCPRRTGSRFVLCIRCHLDTRGAARRCARSHCLVRGHTQILPHRIRKMAAQRALGTYQQGTKCRTVRLTHWKTFPQYSACTAGLCAYCQKTSRACREHRNPRMHCHNFDEGRHHRERSARTALR